MALLGLIVPVLGIIVQVESEPVIELDAELPSIVGETFLIQVTAFDRSNETITVKVIFDSNDKLTAYSSTKDYFVNYEMNISTSGSWGRLETGKNHNITILAENNHGDQQAIIQDIEIDRSAPEIRHFTPNYDAAEGETHTVHYGESVVFSWDVVDDHFLEVRILKDGDIDHSIGTAAGTKSISFDLPGEMREKVFIITMEAVDEPGNVEQSNSYKIRYIDDRIYQEPAQSEAERRKSFWRNFGGTSTGIFIAILLGAFLGIEIKTKKMKGYK